jgi:hypothetical protein
MFDILSYGSRLLQALLVGSLATGSPALLASTQAGSCTVVKIDPEKKALVLSIDFMEYFSGPGEFMPGMTWTSQRNAGTPFSDRTMWVIDGRTVRWDIGAAALEPGSTIYHYGSRKTTEFIHIYQHEPVVIGALQWTREGELELFRLMLRRFDTDAAVYQRFRRTIADDAVFLDQGQPSTAEAVLVPGRMVRVLPAQKQLISTFSEDAVLQPEQLHENHRGMRTGTMLGQAQVIDRKGKPQPGCRLRLSDGTEIDYGFDRKGYAVLDGTYISSREPIFYPGQRFTAGLYRGWTKAKYMLVRSNAMQALDGRITAFDGQQLTVQLDGGDSVVTIPVQDEAQFRLNGQAASVDVAVQIGRLVTIFRQRPQVIEAIATGQPTPGFSPLSRRLVETQPNYAIIDYDHEGNRRVLRDGYNPYFDDSRVKASPPGPSAGPAGWTSISRAEAMALHPDAETILASTVLRPAGSK